MKRFVLFFFTVLGIGAFCQQPPNKEVMLPGPVNISPGIIDGVVIKEDVPQRVAMKYEYVRAADYVWSKRIFSRIDSREKINHELFYPFDIFNEEYEIPKTADKVYSDPFWVKHQERWSLWTIIYKHVLLGDLTVYMPFDREYLGKPKKRDGYQFKYPILPKQENKMAFFDPTEDKYRESVIKSFSNMSKGISFVYQDLNGQSYRFVKTATPFDQWWSDPQSQTKDGRYLDDIKSLSPGDKIQLDNYKETFERCWNAVAPGEDLREPDVVKPVSSQAVVAYNIKEDWFFDKERSILDKRIIAIAPVAEYKVKLEDGAPSGQADEGTLVYVKPNGEKSTKERTFQAEMFWLYFPQLRETMAKYYTYNNRSDAQWMSFDDLFF
jgi:hypothetical protein